MISKDSLKQLNEKSDSGNKSGGIDDELTAHIKEIKDGVKFISFCIGNLTFIAALNILGKFIDAL